MPNFAPTKQVTSDKLKFMRRELIDIFRNSRAAALILVILGCLLVFWVQWNASVWLAPLHMPSRSLGRYISTWLLSFVPVTIILFLLHRPSRIIEALGLKGSVLRGLMLGFLFTAPLYIGFAIIGSLNSGLTLNTVLLFCVLPALFEEILFRGFIFSQLFRAGRLGFFWAALLPAVLFGLFHIYQGHDFLSSLAAFGVTMLGSFFFSWMYVVWNYNLWVPISIHFFMNLAWSLFVVEGTGNAAGGLISNILRAICLIFAIVFTIYYNRQRNKEALKFPIFKI